MKKYTCADCVHYEPAEGFGHCLKLPFWISIVDPDRHYCHFYKSLHPVLNLWQRILKKLK